MRKFYAQSHQLNIEIDAPYPTPEVEIGGVLARRSDGTIIGIRLEPVDAGPNRIKIPVVKGVRMAQQMGLMPVGTWHTHPRGTGPSRADHAILAHRIRLFAALGATFVCSAVVAGDELILFDRNGMVKVPAVRPGAEDQKSAPDLTVGAGAG